MRIAWSGVIAVGVLFGAGVCLATAQQKTASPAAARPAGEADRETIIQSGRDFIAAYEKGDAKAVAQCWTEQGEYESDDGTILRGRAAIEAAFDAHFKSRPGGKMEIKVESIRFPSRDVAIEEGYSRTTEGGALPDSTFYRTVHVREDGKWRMVLSREWGATESRMTDLDWLLGSWRSVAKAQEMSISFQRDKQGPFLVGEFTTTTGGKAVPLGTMKVGLDPVSGKFTSWHFDPDGGHGQGSWLREGNNWVVDSVGTRADGAETASVNILTRHGSDEIGWRTIDKFVGGKPQPDAPPIRLKRVPPAK